jgi:hypothetical protein
MARTRTTLLVALAIAAATAIGAGPAANALPANALPPRGITHAQWAIDIQRITQGLDRDFSANVDYDHIPGKDLLVRVQPYANATLFASDLVPTSESCTVRQISQLVGNVEVPFAGTPHKFAAGETPAQGFPILNARKFQEDLLSPQINCWVPGTAVPSPGRYDFAVTMSTQGVPQAVSRDLGTELFGPASSFNILLLPWFHPPDDPRYLAPSPATYAHAANVEQEMDRTLPLATNVSSLNDDGLHPSGGLHVTLAGPFICPLGAVAIGNKTSSCDAQTRALGGEEIDYWNATAAALDAKDGRHRDRYLTGTTMGEVSQLNGGQSCWSATQIAGSDIGPTLDDLSAFILTQEMLHCIGFVDTASPNSDPNNPPHSKNQTIAMNLFNIPGSMVNMLNHKDYATAYSVMYPFFDHFGDATSDMLEGYEWNELRGKLLTLNPLPSSSSGLLDLDMLIDSAGTSAYLVYAGRSTSDSLPITQPAASSDYELAFLDANGAVITSQPVDGSFANSVHDSDTPSLLARNIDVHVPVPDGAAGWELLHDGQPQLSEPLSTQTPHINTVSAIPDPANHTIHFRWSASGASFYRLFYQPTPSTPSTLVANGLTDPAYDVPTDYLTDALHGTFTLVASNGNVTTQQSVKEPVTNTVSLSIIGPPAGTAITAGVPTTFQTIATLGAEPLFHETYRWTVDSVVVGHMGTLTTALTAGVHNVSVEVRSRHPGTDTIATQTVNVNGP